MRATFAIAMVCLVACGAGPEASTEDGSMGYGKADHNSAASSSSGSGGAGGGGGKAECNLPDPNYCKWDCEKDGPYPQGCACDADCPQPQTECTIAVCNKGKCGIAIQNPEFPCNNGVGVCGLDAECIPPVGICKANTEPKDAPYFCLSDQDCYDANGCTTKSCISGVCRFTPLLDGVHDCIEPKNDECTPLVVCGNKDQACNRGGCCNYPKGQCDPLDFNNLCSPAGTICGMKTLGEGLCWFGQCCLP